MSGWYTFQLISRARSKRLCILLVKSASHGSAVINLCSKLYQFSSKQNLLHRLFRGCTQIFEKLFLVFALVFQDCLSRLLPAQRLFAVEFV